MNIFISWTLSLLQKINSAVICESARISPRVIQRKGCLWGQHEVGTPSLEGCYNKYSILPCDLLGESRRGRGSAWLGVGLTS